jgi:hypothetical protein
MARLKGAGQAHDKRKSLNKGDPHVKLTVKIEKDKVCTKLELIIHFG